jgi:hypothetical protein
MLNNTPDPAARRLSWRCIAWALLLLLSACNSQPPAEPQPTTIPASVLPSSQPQPTPSAATATATVEATAETRSPALTLITETATLATPQPLQTSEVVDRPLRSVQALTDGSRKYKTALWSPGANWIAATPQDGPGLDAINVGSGEVRALVTDTFVLEPIWFDADTLLVQRVAADGDQLVRVTLTEQGSTIEPLVTNAPPLRAISTAGGSVAFATAEQLYVQHEADRQEVALPLPALISAPAPQRRNGLMVALNPTVANLESVATLLLRITGDRATLRPLSNPGEGLWLPRWSADGDKLVLTSIEGRIVASSVDGAERFDLGPGDLPSWSPDGERIAYAGTSAGLEFLDRDIHVVDWRGQGPRLRLTNANDEQFFTSPSWSPDGTRIAFVEIDDGKIYVGTPSAH